jgi:hypothetical protein
MKFKKINFFISKTYSSVFYQQHFEESIVFPVKKVICVISIKNLQKLIVKCGILLVMIFQKPPKKHNEKSDKFNSVRDDNRQIKLNRPNCQACSRRRVGNWQDHSRESIYSDKRPDCER